MQDDAPSFSMSGSSFVFLFGFVTPPKLPEVYANMAEFNNEDVKLPYITAVFCFCGHPYL